MSCTDTTKLKGEFEAQLKDADTKITKVKEELVKLNEYRTKLVGGLETLALLEQNKDHEHTEGEAAGTPASVEPA
tara:strand:+ start:248 stop:472 length:225 start_codon:yes stop_codon:yes gene_type:complete